LPHSVLPWLLHVHSLTGRGRDSTAVTLWLCDVRIVTRLVVLRHPIVTLARHVEVVEAASISASRCDGAVVVSVEGCLDAASARTLLDVMGRATVDDGALFRVEVDLRRMRSCSTAGVTALAICARLGANVSQGLWFRVGTPASAEEENG
jgi:hypothetical protein